MSKARKIRKILRTTEPSFENLLSLKDKDFDWEMYSATLWYKNNMPPSKKKEKKWVLDYVTQNFGKKKVKAYSHADNWDYQILSLYCRVLSRLPKGFDVPCESLNKFINEKFNTIEKKTKIKLADKRVRQQVTAPKISIQERIQNQIQEYLGEIERQIDLIYEEPNIKKNEWFRLDKWLESNKVKGQQSDSILKRIKQATTELESAYNGECPQLKEGYDFISKPTQRRLIDCFQTWIYHVQHHIDNLNKKRTTKRKVISPEKKVRKVSYLPEYKDDIVDVVSVHPKEIIYSSTAIVYDVKSRLITVFVSKQNQQLTIAGTTLYNYSEDNSYTKKVRSPRNICNVIPKCNSKILVLEYTDEKIKTKKQLVRKRLNKNTIILKVF